MATAVGPLRLLLENVAALPEARHTLADWLEQIPVPEPLASDLVAAAGELCANAVRAAASKTELTARVDAKSIVIEVVDDGEGIAGAVPEAPPAPHVESGRGLYLVRQLVDVLWIRRQPDGRGTRATFARRLDA